MEITITRPDDWHLHVRNGAMLRTVVPHTARRFGRAIIMPNTVPPVTTVPMAEQYRQEVLDAVPEGSGFEPLMTLYLTEETTPETVRQARASGIVKAFKLYPAGATTNSASGVTDFRRIYPVLEAMQDEGMPLLVHGEVVDDDIDIFDREKAFIDRVLTPVIEDFPALPVVMEHVTTRDAVDFVMAARQGVGATMTPQHLLYNRNDMLVGGIRPHFYCLPILKRETHRDALIRAATSGSPKFFLGTDSAPHPRHAKESACGCAGVFSAHAAIEFYAEAFESLGALDYLEGFASHFGADFYGLPYNTDTITLVREEQEIPEAFPVDGEDSLVPLRAGRTVRWRLKD